jgi:hypothetical protein
MQNSTEKLLSAALAVMLEHQRTGCKKTAEQLLITLGALIKSRDLSAELNENIEAAIEQLELQVASRVNPPPRQIAPASPIRKSKKMISEPSNMYMYLSPRIRSRAIYADTSLE